MDLFFHQEKSLKELATSSHIDELKTLIKAIPVIPNAPMPSAEKLPANVHQNNEQLQEEIDRLRIEVAQQRSLLDQLSPSPSSFPLHHGRRNLQKGMNTYFCGDHRRMR